LDQLLDAWTTSGKMPKSAGALSGGQWRALALAAEHPLERPILDFLILDGWLQAWVMTRLGAKSFIGTRIGVDVDWQ
jgi:ABC-type cobalamin transport system ATPase subunit